jgi:predicted metal-dependent hydrolase
VASWRDKDQFKARVREWADKLGVRVRSLAVRPMRNKWASCSTAGNLNFSDDLLALDRELADYVIVHELLHFYVPNHGKLCKSRYSFWHDGSPHGGRNLQFFYRLSRWETRGDA